MKKLRKFKLVQIMTICAMAIGVFKSEISAAEEYIPIINHDRIWESRYGEWGPLTIKYMKFDGTGDFLGHTYHEIVTFKKTIVDLRIPVEDSVYEFFDNIYEHEGYLREENGKVYTLVMENSDANNYSGYIYVPFQTYNEDFILNEKLIYDIGSKEGDCYNAFSNVVSVGGLFNFKTVERKIETIDEQECIMIGMCSTDFADNYKSSYKVIEGIGPIQNGCLNYTEFVTNPTRPWEYNYFNRLFDLNGNEIYRNPEDCINFNLPNNIFNSVKTLGLEKDYFITRSNDKICYGDDTMDNAINIYDINGCLLKSDSSKGRIELPTTDLKNGLYIAVASSDGVITSYYKFCIN